MGRGVDPAVLTADVPGAPVAIGQRVTVCDSGDDSFDQRFAGQRGKVPGLLYDAPEQFPDDPMVLVVVAGVGEDMFFPEELGLGGWACKRLLQLRKTLRQPQDLQRA